MEELLYILLGAAWLILSYLGNKRRRQAQAQRDEENIDHYPTEPYPQVPEEKSNQPDFEVLLDEFFGETTKPKPIPGRREEMVIENVNDNLEEIPMPSEYKFEGYDTYESGNKAHKPAISLEKYQGTSAVSEDYEFSYEGLSLESLEYAAETYADVSLQIIDSPERMADSNIENEQDGFAEIPFDARRAVMYAEIINRRYT